MIPVPSRTPAWWPRRLAAGSLGRTLVTATLGSGAVWGGGTLATLVMGAILARGLGPAGYGAYGTAIAAVTVLMVPAQMGLPLLATREIASARATGRDDAVVPQAWWFVLAVATAGIVLGVLLAAASRLPIATRFEGPLAAAGLLLPLLAVSALAIGLLRGEGRVVRSQAIDVLLRPLINISALAALAWGASLTPSTAVLAQSATAAAIALIALLLFFGPLPRGFDRRAHRLRTWASAAAPITLIDGMRAIEGSYGVIVAGALVSAPDAGILRVATASVLVVALPLSLQNIVLAPHLARAHAEGARDRLALIVAGSGVFTTVSTILATVALAVLGHWAIRVAFGAAYEGAYWPLLTLCVGQLAAAMQGPGVMLLCMAGEERYVARGYVVSTVLTVVLAIVLTPTYGIVATAAAGAAGTLLRGAMLNRRARQKLGIRVSVLGAGVLLRRD